MGVTKTTHQEGTGPQAQVGQTVTIEYTGFLKDTSKPDNKGKQYAFPLPSVKGPYSPGIETDSSTSTAKDSTAPLAVATLLPRLALARSSRVSLL